MVEPCLTDLEYLLFTEDGALGRQDGHDQELMDDDT